MLLEAVAKASNWNDVARSLGRRPSTMAISTVQGHALRLGLDVRHLPSIPEDRRWLDDPWEHRRKALPDAIRSSRSWAEVLRRLGAAGSGSAYPAAKHLAKEMGLDTSHLPDAYNKRQLSVVTPIPFAAPKLDANLPAAALGHAIAWFLERGYMASVPVEPVRYDLIAESDTGLKRVQVKTTASRRKGQWTAQIVRMEYGSTNTVGSNGKRTRTVYTSDEIDLFFIITSDGDRYLIPIEVTNGAKVIILDRKYGAYRV